ncbi:hypothetical protein ACET3Z_007569 [Daucus carota]
MSHKRWLEEDPLDFNEESMGIDIREAKAMDRSNDLLFLLQGLMLFYFEAFTGFSGQSDYDDWYMLSYNVILTSLPVISLGVFEQDVSSDVLLHFPALYQQR